MNPLRSLAEYIFGSVVLKRKLPKDFGYTPFYVTADSALGYLKPQLPSKELLQFASEFVKPGATVWDVGANVGLFTFASAALAGESGNVLAIEADISLANLLYKSVNLRANDKLNVTILPLAASDTQEISRFLIARRGRSSNSLERAGHRSQAGGTRYVQYTPTLTLDSLLAQFDAPDVMKIDVEGAEHFVLKGASKILQDKRPVIYCEVGRNQNEEISRILQSFNYVLLDPENREAGPQPHCFYNTLAIPAEHPGR